MSDQELRPVPFPGLGVHKADEQGTQPPGTTPAASNCRLFEALSRRGRGGSRAGWSKLVGAAVNGGAPVQNLAVVVTTDVEATLAFQDPYQSLSFPTAVFDPSTNNRYGGIPGEPGPGPDTGGPVGGGVGAPDPGAPGEGGHTGPGEEPSLPRNKGRKVRNGGSGVVPVRGVPSAYPDGSQPNPGHATYRAVVAAYDPDNVPYVYRLTVEPDNSTMFAEGDGITQSWPVSSHVLVEVTGATTADGFGVPAGFPVVTILGT